MDKDNKWDWKQFEKTSKKSVDKHKQTWYNKYIIKKGKSKRLKGKKLW